MHSYQVLPWSFIVILKPLFPLPLWRKYLENGDQLLHQSESFIVSWFFYLCHQGHPPSLVAWSWPAEDILLPSPHPPAPARAALGTDPSPGRLDLETHCLHHACQQMVMKMGRRRMRQTNCSCICHKNHIGRLFYDSPFIEGGWEDLRNLPSVTASGTVRA